MGILRKIGKKIKKGIKKLMSHKLGRIVGMIGLSMAMGYAAKALMTGMQGAGATAGLAEGALAETATTAGLAEGAGATAGLAEGTATTAGLAEGAGATAGLAEGAAGTPLIEEITVSAVKKIPDTLSIIEKASTNTEAFSTALNEIEAGTMSQVDKGISVVNPDALHVSNNITGAVDHQFNTTFNPEWREWSATQQYSGYGPDTQFYKGPAASPPKPIELYDPVKGRIEAGIDQETLVSKLSETGKYTGPVEGAGQGSLLDPVTVPIPEVEVLPFGERAKGWLRETFVPQSGSEFAADVTKGVITGELMSVIAGEPEEPFYSKGVSQRLESIPAQDAYMTAIRPSFQEATNTNIMPNFEKLGQFNLFGTGTKEYLGSVAGNNQLLFPNILGLPS